MSADPTIGACWDADRLTLVRYGMRIDPERISNERVRAALPTFVRIARDGSSWYGLSTLSWERVVEEYGLLDVVASVC